MLRQMLLDPPGLPVRVDHHRPHPGRAKPIQRMIQQCPPTQRQQRLGGMFRQRPHPRP